MPNSVRSLHLLILKFTESCNLRCRICSYWRSPAKDALSVEAVTAIIEGLRSIPPYALVTGGEPLVIPWLESIVRRLVEADMLVALCTNGVLVTKHLQWISELLDELFVSVWHIYPVSQDRLRGSASWAKMVDGVSKLAGYTKRPQIILRWTVMPENISDLVHFPQFAAELGVYGISIQPADIRTDAFGPKETLTVWKPGILPKELIIESICNFREKAHALGILAQDEESLSRIQDYILAACGYCDFHVHRCNAPERSIVVNPDMSIAPCYFLPSVGSIRSTSISEFRSSVYSEWLSDFNQYSHPRCRSCVCPRIYPV